MIKDEFNTICVNDTYTSVEYKEFKAEEYNAYEHLEKTPEYFDIPYESINDKPANAKKTRHKSSLNVSLFESGLFRNGAIFSSLLAALGIAAATATATNYLAKNPIMVMAEANAGPELIYFHAIVSNMETNRDYQIIVTSNYNYEKVYLVKEKGTDAETLEVADELNELHSNTTYYFTLQGDNGEVGGYINYSVYEITTINVD